MLTEAEFQAGKRDDYFYPQDGTPGTLSSLHIPEAMPLAGPHKFTYECPKCEDIMCSWVERGEQYEISCGRCKYEGYEHV